MISHSPSRCKRIARVAGDQMDVEVRGPFAKGDRIHPITSRQITNHARGPLNNLPPLPRFVRLEIHRSSEMAASIEQAPSQKR